MNDLETFRARRRMRRQERQRRRNRRAFALILITGLVILGIFAAMGTGGPRRVGEVTLRIEPGASTAQIARLLKDEDVIESEKEFMKRADEIGVADNLKPGTYRFVRGQTLQSILTMLEQGQRAPESVLSVPEGFSAREIAADLQAKTAIAEEVYLAAAATVSRSLPLSGSAEAKTLEGFLFPSTYDLEPGMGADTLVDIQLENFQRQTEDLPWEKSAALGLTEYEALIVASLVEREARVPEERPLVAAVIFNRLSAGMKLEVDATVQYALGSWKEELTQQDLDTDSPFNTRIYAGLPPGPICNPGIESIRAALEPAAVDYLFYVAEGDEEGHHFFTASYEEFLSAKEGRQATARP